MSNRLRDQLSQFQDALYEPFDEATGSGLTRPEPTAAELAVNYSAPGRDATHRYGVVFRADYETIDDGMCRQARLHARALAGHVPLLLSSINHRMRVGGSIMPVHGDDVMPNVVLNEVGPLRHTRMRHSAAVVYHTLIKSAAQLKGLMIPSYLRSQIGGADRALRSIVVYTPWERTTVDPDIVKTLNRVGQVWLQCESNRAVFVDAGVKPERVRLVPNAYIPHSGAALVPEANAKPPPGRRYYNIGKWEPRKAHHELIGAFLLAHEPADGAILTIKTAMFGKWRDYPTPNESLEIWADLPGVRARGWTPERIERAVAIYDRFFADEEITKLHALHNVYVSASHAEGWDYPAFDAVSAGNRLVYVPFGGAEDFHGADDVAVPATRGPVHPQYQWEPGAKWAEYDILALALAMRRAEVPTTRRAPVGLEERFGANAVGRRMAGYLRELVLAVHPQAADEMFAEAL